MMIRLLTVSLLLTLRVLEACPQPPGTPMGPPPGGFGPRGMQGGMGLPDRQMPPAAPEGQWPMTPPMQQPTVATPSAPSNLRQHDALMLLDKGEEIRLDNPRLKVRRKAASLICAIGNGHAAINGGSIRLTSKSAPLIEVVASTRSTVTLTAVSLDIASGQLMRVGTGDSKDSKKLGGSLILDNGSYRGDIVVDSLGQATVKVRSGATLDGAIDHAATAATTTAEVQGTWNLTADSHVDRLVIGRGGTINRNGFQLTFNKLTNNGMLN